MEKSAGNLYIVATPIGNLDDITYRAVTILKEVDLVAAEDTRHSKKLLQHLGVNKPMLSLHDFNERDRSQRIIDEVKAGKNVALVSDAGTPLISDPGYYLVSEARGQGVSVVPIPGVSALITALSVAGIATNRFTFEGFLPAKSSGRRKFLAALSAEPRTMVFYESPHRVLESLMDMQDAFGGERQMAVARELTKTYETIQGGTFAEVLSWMCADANQQRGEFVIVVSGACIDENGDEGRGVDVARLLQLLSEELPIKKVARLAAELTGLKKNDLYERLLKMRD